MKEIKGKVVSYSEIPEELIEEITNLSMNPSNSYIEVHIDDFEEDELSKWLKKTYPGIEDDTFYIEID